MVTHINLAEKVLDTAPLYLKLILRNSFLVSGIKKLCRNF